MKILACAIALALVAAAEKKPAGPPTEESLNYSINWPTGLSLGEARLKTQRVKGESAERWETEFTLDASVPGFPVVERARSSADPEFCSAMLEKSYTRGKRKSDEITTFDQQGKTAKRETKGGGKSDLSLQSCAKDAVAYLGYLRRELSQGRLPPHQTIYFGAPYRISVQYTGSQQITVSESRVEADRLLVTLKGEKTDLNFEIFFSKDAAKTPLLVKVPLQLATFTAELIK